MASNTTPIGLAHKSKKISVCPNPLIESLKTKINFNSVTLKNLRTIKIRQDCRLFTKNLKKSTAECSVLQKAYSLNDEVINSSIAGFLQSENLFSEVKTKKTLTDKHAKILEICESGVKSNPGCCEFLNNMIRVLKEVFCDTEQTIIILQERTKSHEETKQTLKILKKRFQKLAFENLELNSSLSNKEKKIFRLNAKIKNLKSKKINLDENLSVIELKDELVRSDNQLKHLEYKNESPNTKTIDFKQFSRNEDKVEGSANYRERFLSVLDNNNQFFSKKLYKSFEASEKSVIEGGKSSKNNSFFNDFDFIF